MNSDLNRRQLLLAGSRGGAISLIAGAASASTGIAATTDPSSNERPEEADPFVYSLNTGTIRGQKLTLPRQIEVAAEAGYTGIEPWTRDMQKFLDSGGSLADLRKRAADLGLEIVSAIGFADWLGNDEQRRAAGIEQMKREMDWVRQLGGARIAAPPAGMYRVNDADLRVIARRYHNLLEIGQQVGVVPQLEIWGTSGTLSRLSEAIFVAVEAAHPDACLLLDAYHLYRGGSDLDSLRLVSGAAMHAFHINDYPAQPPREEMNDSHRVFPGDGAAPLERMLRDLYETGFRGALSLELFNREYWKLDALVAARTGLEKTKAVVKRMLEGRREP